MRHTSRLKTFTWYSAVTLLVLFAVLVSVVRLSIGSVGEYRQRMEEMAGRYLGQPVAIASIDARLVGLKPTVVLDDIALLDEASMAPMAHFRSVMIALNPLSSLRQLRPVIDLSVHGAKIVVGLREDGTFQIQGVSLSPPARDNSSSGALGAWFLGQSRLALKDSTLVWRDWVTGDEAVFAGVNLELQNLQNRHRLSGYVKLPKELGRELRLALDIQGDLLNRNDWEGELYVKAVQVQPTPWLQQFDYKGLRLQQGSVDLDIWSRWHGGLLDEVEGQFDLAGLAFSGAGDSRMLQRLAGQMRYETTDEGWLFQLKQLQLQHGEPTEERLALQLEKKAESTVLQASVLPLELLQRYAPYLPQLLKAQRSWLVQAAPAGTLDKVRVELAEGGRVKAVATVNGVHFSPWQRYPGISGLSGKFAMDGSAAQLLLDSTDLELALPRLFREPLTLQRASGSVQFDKQGGQWRVSGNSVQVSNPDIKADVSFDSWIDPGEAPLISLSAQVQDGRAAAVPDYLPVHIMSAGSVGWLDQAFVDGRIASGQVLLHGRLDSFPFRQQQGRFEIQLEADDVTLHYQDGWPNLAQVNGEVRFDGAGMAIDARQAAVFSGQLSKTRVGIADFKQPVLKVEGKARAPLADVLRFLQASPLSQHAAGALDQIRAEGETQFDLALAIPLSTSVAESSPLRVTGRGVFKQGRIQVAEGVEFSDVTGNLSFSEKKFEAQAIKGRLYDAPTQIDVFTDRERIVIAAQGRATSTALQRELGFPILDRLDGEADWQAGLTVERGNSGGSTLAVHSSLQGMAIDLPLPAAKERPEARPLSVTLQLGRDNTRPDHLRYGDVVSVAWQHKPAPFRLTGAAVEFGDGPEPPRVTPGVLHFGGRLERFPLNDWLSLRQEISPSGKNAPVLPLELDMQRLHIAAFAEGGTGAPLRVADIPPVSFAVKDFAYGDLSLGKVECRVRPAGKRMIVDTLQVTAPAFAGVANGDWVEGGSSRFELELSSGDFGRMMRELGIASVISGGKTAAKGRLFWPGSPSAFSVGKLGGELHLKIEEGRIEEMKPGAGRLLGLLSLQALPKRLFLDFSDLSEKGLQFTKIEGDIRFAEGDAYTENLHLESLPANMLISGRTGLVRRDFDQLIAVVPNVSDTVSVAGALAWGPQVAAALLLLQKVFKSGIDAATMTRYELTGSWTEPKLTRLDPIQAPGEKEGL